MFWAIFSYDFPTFFGDGDAPFLSRWSLKVGSVHRRREVYKKSDFQNFSKMKKHRKIFGGGGGYVENF